MSLSNKINRKFVDSIDLCDWEVETDTGWKDCSSIHKTIEYEIYKLETENGTILESADDHIVFDENMNEIFVKDCIPGQTKIQTKDGLQLIKSIENTNTLENMYDITVSGDDHRYYTNNILSHNTTTAACVILHYILFNRYKRVALLANKADAAREILERIKIAYEALPKWIQQGINEWNKGSISLENGSTVIAAATSSSSIRGKSCVSGDTRVCIEDDDNYYFTEISTLINKK